MEKLIRKLFVAATFVAAVALSAAAQARIVTVDFDDPNLTGLYFAGDSFNQSGFKMTVDVDFGTVDVAAALGPAAPSGDATPFYFQANDGGLIVEREDGDVFDLVGFSAAFVPLIPPSPLTTAIVAVGLDVHGGFVGVGWLFAPAVNNVYPFATYDDPLDFAGFKDMVFIEFFSCSVVGGQLCTAPTENDGQFALDNIQLSVPEPGSVALVMLAMLALGMTMTARRRLG